MFGLLLIVIGVVVMIPYTSLADSLPNVFQKDGYLYDCVVSLDKDSIHSGSCNQIKECSTLFNSFNSLLEVQRTLSLEVGGKSYGETVFEADFFGNNEDIGLSACVPKTYSKANFFLYNDEGSSVATPLEVTLS